MQTSISDCIPFLSSPRVVPKHLSVEKDGSPVEVMTVPVADTQLTRAKENSTVTKVFIVGVKLEDIITNVGLM